MNRSMWLLLLVSSPSWAQFSGPYTNILNGSQWDNVWAAQQNFHLSQAIQKNMVLGASRPPAQAPPTATATAPTSTPPVRHQPLSASDFKPAGPRTQPAAFGASAPEGEREQLTATCTQLLDAIEGQDDFRRNNVAYAVAVLVGSAIQVLGGQELPDEQAVELARTLNDALAASDAFRRMSGRQRQVMYETSIILGGLMQGLDQGDQDARAQARQLARTVLASMGVKAP